MSFPIYSILHFLAVQNGTNKFESEMWFLGADHNDMVGQTVFE